MASEPARTRFTRSEGLMLAAIVVPFLLWLVRWLILDFWYDEVFTLTNYVLVPLSRTATDYSFPNNHVLFNLLTNLVLRLTGTRTIGSLLDQPALLRLLPLLFSLAALIYTYLVGRRLFGRTQAQLALAVLVTTVPFCNFAVQIRGFSMSFMLLAMLLYHSLRFESRTRWHHSLLVVLTTALALYAIPLNLYFIAALGSWMLITGLVRHRTSEHRRRLLLVVLLVAGVGLAALLYSPMLHQVLGNRFVQSHGLFHLPTLVSTLPRALDYFLSFRYLLIPAFALGLYLLFRNPDLQPRVSKRFLLMLVVLLFGPFVLSFVRGDHPYLRVFVNLAPVFALLLGACLAPLASRPAWLRKRPWLLSLIVIVYCNLTFAFALIRVSAHIRADIETGRKSQNIMYNYYQAWYAPRRVLGELKRRLEQQPAPVVCLDFDQAALPEYLKHSGIAWHRADALGPLLASEDQLFVITAFPSRFRSGMTPHFPGFSITQLNRVPDFHSTFLMTRR